MRARLAEELHRGGRLFARVFDSQPRRRRSDQLLVGRWRSASSAAQTRGGDDRRVGPAALGRLDERLLHFADAGFQGAPCRARLFGRVGQFLEATAPMPVRSLMS